MTLTGAQILELLKAAVVRAALRPGAAAVGRASATPGARATAAAITGRPCATRREPGLRPAVHGEPVSESRGYRVTVNSSMAAGGGPLPGADGAARSGSGGPEDTEALEAYLAPSLDGRPLAPPALDRITRVP